MRGLFESLDKWRGAEWRQRDAMKQLSRAYECRCGTRIFFANTQCLSCGSPLGYLPQAAALAALDPGAEPGTVTVAGYDGIHRPCGNRETPAQCNWLVPADDHDPLCIACRLNHTIPNLYDADNARYWAAIEAAKRRLVAQLLALGLPIRSRVNEDPERGLMFRFLRRQPGEPAVTTGHADGVITIDIEEADAARREQLKQDLHEPYRTLLGHFRHEVGHYYWDRLVRDSKWLAPFRELFGDERADYAEALKRNYEQGPPAGWTDSFISSYATTHPWEDWAETWAQYLHMADSLGTAIGFGLDAADLESRISPFTRDDLYAAHDPGAARFLSLLNSWIEMIMVLNELARSMGQPDFYPFVMSRPVVAKLQLIYMIVADVQAESVAAA
ncbi:MAG TPA: putative zinc-binding metallopeptidase [Burkholderiaceae bacterium]